MELISFISGVANPLCQSYLGSWLRPFKTHKCSVLNGHMARNDLAVCRNTFQWIRNCCRNPAPRGGILCVKCVTAYDHVSAAGETDVQMWPQDESC